MRPNQAMIGGSLWPRAGVVLLIAPRADGMRLGPRGPRPQGGP